MDKSRPIEISAEEWKEILQVSAVRENWGIEKNESVDDFRSMVYGVKFNFVSGGPGYVGDLFIIQGDTLEKPLLLIRKDGALVVTAL
jgi:hypothetical protein